MHGGCSQEHFHASSRTLYSRGAGLDQRAILPGTRSQALQPTTWPHNFVRLLRDGWGATFSAAAFDELRQRLMHIWIHGGRLEGSKSVAPQGTCALGCRLGAIVRPCAEVPPIRDKGNVEGVTVTLHRVSCCKEMATGSRLRDCLDPDVLSRCGHRLKDLGEHLQHFDVEDELFK